MSLQFIPGAREGGGGEKGGKYAFSRFVPLLSIWSFSKPQ